jgi:streptomycin 6-kinase
VPWIRSRLTALPLDDMPPHRQPVSEHQRRDAIGALDVLGPPPPGRLCHGDLSPGNVLVGRDRLWLIDPRGINGESAYDVAVVALKACLDDPDPAADLARSLAEAARTDSDRAARWVPIAAAACV